MPAIYNFEQLKKDIKKKKITTKETMIFKLLLTFIILSPLPFACNRAWSWSLLCLLTALICMAWSIGMLSNRNPSNNLWRQLKWPIALYCLPLTWAVIQLTPDISSQMNHPIWSLAGSTLQIDLPGYISTSPYDTATALMRLIAYGLVFLMSAHYCQESRQAKTLFSWISFAGFCYAGYGLIIFFGDYKSILWYAKTAYQNDVTSTFINRNSYATYTGLGILCTIPILYEKIKNSLYYGLKNNFGRQYFIEQLIKQSWFVIANMIILITALFLTHSRGGFLSALVGLLGFFVLLSIYKHTRHGAFTYSTTGFLLMALVIFEISGENLMHRFNAFEESSDGRFKIYDAIANGINQNPWYGLGYGTFENSFRLYRNEDIPFHINFGHNTYLENIFELGLLQALLLFAAIALVALQCLKGVRDRHKHKLYPAIGFSATLLVANHSFMDFSLQIPAVAVTYAAMMGAAYAQSFSHKQHLPL